MSEYADFVEKWFIEYEKNFNTRSHEKIEYSKAISKDLLTGFLEKLEKLQSENAELKIKLEARHLPFESGCECPDCKPYREKIKELEQAVAEAVELLKLSIFDCEKTGYEGAFCNQDKKEKLIEKHGGKK